MAASCMVCGRATFDPGKRDRPWARGVAAGRLVLVCPRCQAEDARWSDRLDSCEACGATRLWITLGEVICRACGHTAPPGDYQPQRGSM